jgi:3D (Asp-Asp-Asp) domain-containing protein|tara:strand:+ start:185 stop:703 length:519 start_codon:yes stop_codon:yes gene_type:complete
MIKLSHAMWVSMLPLFIMTWYFSNLLDEHHEDTMRLQKRVWSLEKDCGFLDANTIAFNVTVTTYNPTRQQCDSTPNITADGTRINPKRATQYRYVALSRDLISRWGGPFDYGDYIVIEGTGKWDGVYQVRDTMNPKWVKRVDILTTNSRFKYNNITMYKYVDNDYLITDTGY